MKTVGYAAQSQDADLTPYEFERRALRDDDVAMEILYSGVCHSDVHTVRGDWGVPEYPQVVGHEIIGRVIEVGSKVTKFAVGDIGAVGCMVDSPCTTCDDCTKIGEPYCAKGMVGTYNGKDLHDGSVTKGGYSKHIVVRDHFVLTVPKSLDISRAAPLLCAGITMYSPLHHWKAGPGKKVAIVGLGGLGHMGVKLAKGMGADVTVISRSAGKEEDAARLGADRVLISTNEDALKEAERSFDLIIDTVPVHHDIMPYVPLLSPQGTICLVGQLGPLPDVNSLPLVFGRRSISGSIIGGIRETQEMLDFCAEKDILPDVETIKMSEINEAWARMLKSDVRYRFVIDMSSLTM
eukprot:CAMPEP_0170738498 /NCGR_PEP_ID=MMETSP0437-20130122/4677_1 /TAXON_ID=0 /ORGANISM="Sexangularia sp." /LENGTH=349 /DNA_ID=CAMNT_0011076925 /DNA_START=64 /DNA_END=1113 /DNA_ORIENTATION=-